MPVYTATFKAVAVTAAQDVFEIVAPSDLRIAIHDIKLGQYTDFGDAAAELLSVVVTRGYTTAGSGGSTVTPANIKSWGPPSRSTVLANNTTVAQNGTGVDVIADTFNIAAGWSLADSLRGLFDSVDTHQKKLIVIKPSERLVVRMTIPADSLTMNGTLVFEEGASL